jgi:hypothetical protein
MEPASALAWMRGLERLGIVGLSGISLILGWDLFRRGVVMAQTADFKAHGWTVRLQRVGPGIFFALFATVAFVSVIAHPLEITTGKDTKEERKLPGTEVTTTTTERHKISEAANPSNGSDRDVITAINTIDLLLIPRMPKTIDSANTAAINKADQILDTQKKFLMFQRFGQLSIQFYSVNEKVPTDPSILGRQTQEFQDKYSEMEGWDKDTFLRRR